MRFIKNGITKTIPNGTIVKVCAIHYMIPCFTSNAVAVYLCRRHHITNIDNISNGHDSISEFVTKKIDSVKIVDKFYVL